jgi:hypothetical protein
LTFLFSPHQSLIAVAIAQEKISFPGFQTFFSCIPYPLRLTEVFETKFYFFTPKSAYRPYRNCPMTFENQ